MRFFSPPYSFTTHKQTIFLHIKEKHFPCTALKGEKIHFKKQFFSSLFAMSRKNKKSKRKTSQTWKIFYIFHIKNSTNTWKLINMVISFFSASSFFLFTIHIIFLINYYFIINFPCIFKGKALFHKLHYFLCVLRRGLILGALGWGGMVSFFPTNEFLIAFWFLLSDLRIVRSRIIYW